MTHTTLTKMTTTRARLLALVESLDDAALDHPWPDGWSIRQTLTHVLCAEEDHTRVIAAIAAGQFDQIPDALDLDTHNQARIAERGRLSLAELIQALADQRQHTEALFNRMSPDDLARIGPHPVVGEQSIDAIFRVIALHDTLHTRDIATRLHDRA